jgi:hypothetical protein
MRGGERRREEGRDASYLGWRELADFAFVMDLETGAESCGEGWANTVECC